MHDQLPLVPHGVAAAAMQMLLLLLLLVYNAVMKAVHCSALPVLLAGARCTLQDAPLLLELLLLLLLLLLLPALLLPAIKLNRIR
jgi:hypothetical protein